MSAWEPVIGLEVHAQLATRSKIFCSCPVEFGASPNRNTCDVCLGRPGALPAMNERALELALRAAIALDCEIQPQSLFERKHYFYPDLPKGYQISQYLKPYALGGGVWIEDAEGNSEQIKLERIHLEEDAGKSIHEGLLDSNEWTSIDLNRAGTPLIEIVSTPTIHHPKTAYRYLERLRSTLRWLEVCDGNMEQGSFRCDANISVRPLESQKLGTRTEIKNLNSFRNVELAIQFEIDRQIKCLEQGQKVTQETRSWDPNRQQTDALRSKEEAADYRYFPEPDLRPLIVTSEQVIDVKKQLPELPWQLKERWVREYELQLGDAHQLSSDPELAKFFMKLESLTNDPKKAANWVVHDLRREQNKHASESKEIRTTPEQCAEILNMVAEKTISTTAARELFETIYGTPHSPKAHVEREGLGQIRDDQALQSVVDDLIINFPAQAADYRGGKLGLLSFFIGQGMKASDGRADPQQLRELLLKKLGETGEAE